MDEARLDAITLLVSTTDLGTARGIAINGVVHDLLDEVRRLQTRVTQLDQYFLATTKDRLELAAEARRLKEAVDQAYSDGESNGLADITGIITDPSAGDDATPEEILSEIKGYLGWEGD